jgi:hypothetical protein
MFAIKTEKGWAGYNLFFVKDLSLAILFKTLPSARAKATEVYIKFNLLPQIVEIILTEGKVLDETNRLKDSAFKTKRRNLKKRIKGLKGYISLHPDKKNAPYYLHYGNEGNITYFELLENLEHKLKELEYNEKNKYD